MKPRVSSVGVHTHTAEAQGTSHDGWWLLVHSGLSFLFSGFPKLKTEADLFTMVKSWFSILEDDGSCKCVLYVPTSLYLPMLLSF